MYEPDSLAKNPAIDEFCQGFIANCLPPSSYHLPILVVDDEPRLRDAVKEILSLAGYQVECAATGREALTLLAEQDFSLVLLDLNLPDISGQKILDEIVSQDIDTNVIIYSGESTFEQATRALRNGAKDFLAKGCAPEILLETVARTLDNWRRQKHYLRVQKHIQCSEVLHRYLINHSPDLIFMLDDQGRLIFVNERAKHYFGLDIQELMGAPFFDFIFAEDQPGAALFLQKLKKGEHAESPVELRLRTPSGTVPRDVEVWALPVELPDPKPIMGIYGIIRDISERKQAETLRNYHLNHDQLTKLPNRNLFHDRLQVALRQARRLDQKLAVMYLDLDRFKLINDSYGHPVGDELLQNVASRVKSCLRDCDTLARISGDEFNLLLPHIKHVRDARTIWYKIQSLFDEPFQVQGHEIRVSFSAGCAVYPDHGETMQLLLRHADSAMYQVKERGRNGFYCYLPEMDSSPCYHMEIENGIHRALANDELRLYYQPQIDLQSGRVRSLEALIRWAHPRRGFLLPAEFMPVVEQSRLVCRLGTWVIRQICLDALEFKKRGYEDLRIAMNVSPQQLGMEGFTQSLFDTIREHRLDSSFLEIEITENSLIQDMNTSMQALTRLAEAGVTIAVDDFGKGYSSLSYLHTLPLHTVKIDRSFVTNLSESSTDTTIIDAILSIARGLRLNFIAEGVETQFQNDYLLNAGCRTAQGYLYAPPLPLDDALAYVRSSRAQAFSANSCRR